MYLLTCYFTNTNAFEVKVQKEFILIKLKKKNQTRNSIDTLCSTLLYIFPVKWEEAVFFKKEFHGARQPPFIYKG